MTLKSLVGFIWKQLQKIMYFLISLLSLTAITIVVLYLLKIKPYVVTTGSMQPAIPVHSICFVNENIPLETIEIGEVISFRIGDNILVTHRITDIQDDEYFTKGDANNTEDASSVTKENYIGKTILVFPKVGIILIYLHSKRGKIVAVTLMILLLILSFLPEKRDGAAK